MINILNSEGYSTVYLQQCLESSLNRRYLNSYIKARILK